MMMNKIKENAQMRSLQLLEMKWKTDYNQSLKQPYAMTLTPTCTNKACQSKSISKLSSTYIKTCYNINEVSQKDSVTMLLDLIT